MNARGRPVVLALVAVLAGACTGVERSEPPSGPSVPLSAPSVVGSTRPTTAPPSPIAPTDPPPDVAAHWEGAGELVKPRQDPTAVTLGDARVLVLGDSGGKYEAVPEHSRAAELWDPATGTWDLTDALPKARGSFAAVTLRDGRALIAGGVNDEWYSYSSAYVFDAASERWAKVGLMGTARSDPAAAVLADGRVLVAGGSYYTGVQEEGRRPEAIILAGGAMADLWPGPSGHALASAELFDPARGTWTTTGSMHYARGAASAVPLADGRVLVTGAGGYTWEGGAAATTAELYDPTAGSFELAETLPAAERSTLESLHLPATAHCERAKLTDMGTLVGLSHGGAMLVDTSWSCPSTNVDEEVELERSFLFDARSGNWTAVEGTAGATWGEEETGQRHPDGVIAAVSDRRVLFGGGEGEDGLGTKAAMLLDPASGGWSELPDMPAARAQAATALLPDGSVLIIGGYSDASDGYPIRLAGTFRFIPGG